ncbi:hypothetical protein E3N88_14096 [Mikania micrantha]|uniref:DM2 domain-containing protein n=1 Tax=Mikania micrantha TaxID=192012 RepID=A0A5N6P349_9ASTR|nr:hypothetical protein E3N88_14096 [Mikania micrantha]
MASTARVFNGFRALLSPAKSASPKPTATVASTTTVAKQSKKSAVKKSTEKPVKTPRRKKLVRSSGILKPSPISPVLAHFLGVSESARTEAVKKIWEYIKSNELQASLWVFLMVACRQWCSVTGPPYQIWWNVLLDFGVSTFI